MYQIKIYNKSELRLVYLKAHSFGIKTTSLPLSTLAYARNSISSIHNPLILIHNLLEMKIQPPSIMA